ncbi:MAG: hypothetical protein JRJ20_04145 [Deltaproteobacteria bacterium]|nr:hypothetical protein [Deltaproteobacteria bacterium]
MVWIPKYRKRVLTDQVAIQLQKYNEEQKGEPVNR